MESFDELSHPRELLRPCLLLLLAEAPAHGYDLMTRLKPFGFDWGGPGPIYRELRTLEDADLVGSRWEAPGAGPARHVYELTAAGTLTLAKWADSLAALGGILDDYRARYLAVAGAEQVPEPASTAGPSAPGDQAEKPAPVRRIRLRRR